MPRTTTVNTTPWCQDNHSLLSKSKRKTCRPSVTPRKIANMRLSSKRGHHSRIMWLPLITEMLIRRSITRIFSRSWVMSLRFKSVLNPRNSLKVQPTQSKDEALNHKNATLCRQRPIREITRLLRAVKSLNLTSQRYFKFSSFSKISPPNKNRKMTAFEDGFQT